GRRHRQRERRLAHHPRQRGFLGAACSERATERQRRSGQAKGNGARPGGAVREAACRRTDDARGKDTGCHVEHCAGREPGSRSDPERAGVALALANNYAVRYRKLSGEAASPGGKDRVKAAGRRAAAIEAGKKKTPPILGGACRANDIESETGARPSYLDARLPPPAARLDDHIAVTRASADRDVAIPVHAVLVAQRADAVFPAEALGARGERKRGRTRQGDRDGEKVGCSHPRASFLSPRDAIQRATESESSASLRYTAYQSC